MSPDPRPDRRYVQGDTVFLTCNATNPPGVDLPLTFRFIHENDEVRGIDLVAEPNAVDGITVATGDGYITLTLSDIRDHSDQEASYLCQVYNRPIHDSAFEAVDIDIICECLLGCVCALRGHCKGSCLCVSLPHSAGPELRFPKSGEPDAIVNLGDDLVIECDGSQSDPEVYLIVITANGIEVDSTTTQNCLSVTINQPQLSDAGTLYECFSANSIGNTTVGFSLTVRGHSLTLIFAYIHVHIHTLTCSHTHTHTHTYTYKHTGTHRYTRCCRQ